MGEIYLFIYIYYKLIQLSELICNKASIVDSLFPPFVSKIDLMTSISNVGNISFMFFISSSDTAWVLAGVFEINCSILINLK